MPNLAQTTRLLFILGALTATGCEQEQVPVVVESRPVKTIVVGGDATSDKRSFAASVDAIKRAEISFRVRGKLNEIAVKEGDEVKQGQLLAALDETDFRIRLDDRKASYETARANYDRAKELVDKGAISRVEHDNIRAQYFTAEANLKAARQDLEYTTLKANFDGVIAKRHVENFEEVLGSQTIFTLVDVSTLKLELDVPENMMLLLNPNRSRRDRNVKAVFEMIPDEEFELEFLEVATRADPSTKTFRATFTMPASPQYNILPGMTATVIAELFPEESGSGSTDMVLPVSAVVSDSTKQPVVWVVDEETMTVSSKAVKTGLMLADSIQVAGLAPGERVVTAGGAFLREDMKVTLLETGEQP